jgi:hypothetical protein
LLVVDWQARLDLELGLGLGPALGLVWEQDSELVLAQDSELVLAQD